uniref:Cytochrome P450 n=1 Tax=Echinostoma caproni TaxID=27848 RepID=A0A183A4R8_9TREM
LKKYGSASLELPPPEEPLIVNPTDKPKEPTEVLVLCLFSGGDRYHGSFVFLQMFIHFYSLLLPDHRFLGADQMIMRSTPQAVPSNVDPVPGL